MKIGIIGAGKVGTAFGLYLKQKGINLIGFYSKTEKSAQKAAQKTNTKVMSLNQLVAISELIIIATPDGEIKKVCDNIAEANLFTKKHTVVHMSGALTSDILNNARLKGASIYSLHPMQSFAEIDKSVEDIKNTFLTMEGQGDNTLILDLLKTLGNPYIEIQSNQKVLYHAAACVASNYLVTLTGMAAEILQKIGFEQQDSLNLLLPLMEGTLKNIGKIGVNNALTGPIVRGDKGTVEKHLETLKIDGEIKELYSLLGLRTLDIAQKRNLSVDKITELEKLLKGCEHNG